MRDQFVIIYYSFYLRKRGENDSCPEDVISDIDLIMYWFTSIKKMRDLALIYTAFQEYMYIFATKCFNKRCLLYNTKRFKQYVNHVAAGGGRAISSLVNRLKVFTTFGRFVSSIHCNYFIKT